MRDVKTGGDYGYIYPHVSVTNARYVLWPDHEFDRKTMQPFAKHEDVTKIILYLKKHGSFSQYNNIFTLPGLILRKVLCTL